MDLKSRIYEVIRSLSWHKQRCLTFTYMVMGLLRSHNVQHHALARGFSCLSLMKSKCERLRRFFAHQDIDNYGFAKALIHGFFGSTPQMHLTLDRTNWKFGKQEINFLVLAASFGRITFPLFWRLLPHRGNSDFQARKEILEQFRETFGFEKILSFSADREFIGKDWLDYLHAHRIPFLSV